MLRNQRVKSSNNYWFVKVCYYDEKLHFKDGWETFCKDHGLEEGDFLVFQHHRNLIFDVFVFDPTCCERPFPADFHQPSTNKVKSSSLNNLKIKDLFKNEKVEGLKLNKNDKVYSTSKATFKPREFPYCETFVKSYCLTWGGMPLPNEFARENDLVNKSCDEMVLKDEEGKEWTVSLRSYRKGRVAYIGKWRNFHNEHGLKTGDPVVFELIESGETPKMNFY
uniref:TF-B3 domain-containing protein n=1 Tax=Chenopodium quinoa TaxID=63459 RepID=A0A803KTI0_CHEQI